MKSFLSLPQNADFFSRYAVLVPTLHRVGYLAQIVSALTEFGILFSLIFDGLNDFFPQFAYYGALFGAVVGTAIIEVGLRQFAPYSVRAILHRRFAGLDLIMSVFIVLTCAGLLISSGVLSFKGSREMVAAVAPEAEQQTTAAADSTYRAAMLAAGSTYRADSSAIAARYAAQIDAKAAEYRSKTNVQKTRLERYKQRERAEGVSYATSISHIKTKIANLEAERDAAIAQMKAKQGDELAIVLNRRQQATDGALGEYAEAKGEVKEFNETSISKTERKTTGYGYGLAWFTVVCIVVFLFSVVLHEVHHKGSGIELSVQASQYDFSAGWIAEALAAANSRFQYKVRSVIHSFDAKTPDPPVPVSPGALYDIAAIDQRRYQVTADDQEEDSEGKVIRMQPRRSGQASPTPPAGPEELANKALHLVEAEITAGNQNHHEAAEEIRLKAEDVIRAYLGQKSTDKDVKRLYWDIVNFLNKQGPNPFAHLHERRPIGFYQIAQQSAPEQPKKAASNGPVNNAPGNNMLGTCDNCGNEYQKKAFNQRFCCTDCRITYHAQKHGGKAYDPNFKYNKK